MRRHGFPLRPKTETAPLRAPEPPKRKVFNCIVDDTALIAGVKRSTRDGIRKWVSQDAIRLFVPLHTLGQLNRLKKGTDRNSADAREAVKWLDEITEQTSYVQLEGVDEAFNTWAEVEGFMLPETLLSMDKESEDEDEDDSVEDLESSFTALEVSDGTSVSSTHSVDGGIKTPQSPRSPKSSFSIAPNSPQNSSTTCNAKAAALLQDSPNRTARNSAEFARNEKSSKSKVPASLQPLFNHILWRIHQETNPNAALESFILLTNDSTKQVFAQKFGIRAKRLEQLRDAVAREDRDYRNRLALYKMETEGPKPYNSPEKPSSARNPIGMSNTTNGEGGQHSEDEDVVLFKRAPRGPQAQNTNGQRVFDPNDFGRVNHNRGGHGSPRGRGGFRGGRGAFAPRGAYVAPGPPVRPQQTPRNVDPNQPIDPDSFARPTPRANAMRGNRRKLWEPN